MTPLLEGIRVLELSAVVMGPFAGQILADLGAEVVKIEPLTGDIARDTPPCARPGMGAMYVNNNRNKKTLALDLKREQGRLVAARLIARSDVLLHNMRVEAMERLGLGFEAAVAINPRLIYCSAIGFGQRGRYRDRPAFDDVIQAASGLAGLSGALGEDFRFIPTTVADKVGALYAVYGILAALIARLRGRAGPIKVEAPMFEALVSFILNEHLAGATFAGEKGSVGYERILSANRRPYRTKDGWIAVLPYTAEQWKRFFRETGRHDILQAPWFADAVQRGQRIDFMYGEVARVLVERTTAEWISVLLELDIPCSEVNTLDDLLTDPHLQDVGFFDLNGDYPSDIARALPQPVIFEGIEQRPDRAAPGLGADTRDVLRQCGYDETEIEALFAEEVVR
ncbi:MAG TPA: CoA transferase [Steroidobacteraceae bacterium]|jgi:crotonobetainyl-CoA:carnitine CoA-transferase CaiB-like acyl-CoA transferase